MAAGGEGSGGLVWDRLRLSGCENLCHLSQRAREKKPNKAFPTFLIFAPFFHTKKTVLNVVCLVNHPRNLLLARKSDMLRTNAQAMMLLSRSVGRSVVHEVKDDNRFHKQNDGV